MSIVWCYCCKAFAYNITALRGIIASKRAMSSILSSLPTSWNGLEKKWNRWLNFARIFRVFIVFNMTLHRWFCSILLILSVTVADRFGLEPLESPWNVFSFEIMFKFLSSLAEEFSEFLSGVSLLEYVIVISRVKLHVKSSCSKLTIWTFLLGSWDSLYIVNGNCGCCCW